MAAARLAEAQLHWLARGEALNADAILQSHYPRDPRSRGSFCKLVSFQQHRSAGKPAPHKNQLHLLKLLAANALVHCDRQELQAALSHD